jgi:hypothetical protein
MPVNQGTRLHKWSKYIPNARFGLRLHFVGVDFGRLDGRVIGLVGTRSWDRYVYCRGSDVGTAASGEVVLLLCVVSCCLGARVVGSCGMRL